jgi:hypothetical protein
MTIARDIHNRDRVRKAVGMLALLTMQGVHLLLRKKQVKRYQYRVKKGNFLRDRVNSLKTIDNLPDYVFKQMFRMTRETFKGVLDKVTEKLPTRDRQDTFAKKNVKGNGGQPLDNKTKLYATIRFLAGGSPWDICLAYNIGFGSFYAQTSRGVIWPIMHAIDKAYDISLDLTKLEQQAKEFRDIMPVSSEVFDGYQKA